MPAALADDTIGDSLAKFLELDSGDRLPFDIVEGGCGRGERLVVDGRGAASVKGSLVSPTRPGDQFVEQESGLLGFRYVADRQVRESEAVVDCLAPLLNWQAASEVAAQPGQQCPNDHYCGVTVAVLGSSDEDEEQLVVAVAYGLEFVVQVRASSADGGDGGGEATCSGGRDDPDLAGVGMDSHPTTVCSGCPELLPGSDTTAPSGSDPSGPGQ